jgi:hypothetical protein
MVANNKIVLQFDMEALQEVASTLRTTVKKIDWVIENRPPKKSELERLDVRAKLLTMTASQIEEALHERAKANPINKEPKSDRAKPAKLRVVDKES